MCLVVSAASFVASIFTGGSTLGIAVLAAGAVATTAGGANAIVETCTDYKANIVVVSQCANLGTIKADNADRVGGIAGHFQQYCYMADCLNAGYYGGTSDNNSGIVDCADVIFCVAPLQSRIVFIKFFTTFVFVCKAV